MQIHKLFLFLQKDLTQVSLTQVGVWFIGEYGEELLDAYYDQARQQQLDAVSEEKVLDLLARILDGPGIDATTKSDLSLPLSRSHDAHRARQALRSLRRGLLPPHRRHAGALQDLLLAAGPAARLRVLGAAA